MMIRDIIFEYIADSYVFDPSEAASIGITVPEVKKIYAIGGNGPSWFYVINFLSMRKPIPEAIRITTDWVVKRDEKLHLQSLISLALFVPDRKRYTITIDAKRGTENNDEN